MTYEMLKKQTNAGRSTWFSPPIRSGKAPFVMLHQVGFAHSVVLTEQRIFRFEKDEVLQAVISMQGAVQSVLFVVDVFFHKERFIWFPLYVLLFYHHSNYIIFSTHCNSSF